VPFAPLVPLVFLSVQEVNPEELQKAIQQDAASAAAGAPAASGPAGRSAPGANAVPDPSLSVQQSVQRPGSSLLNPALSVILDGTFGYYGKNATDFDTLGLPVAGDDPS